MSVVMTGFTQYRPIEGGYVPEEEWGKDHFSTLLYLETRWVDHKGMVKNANMRTDPDLHPEFVDQRFISHGSKKYPTRLQKGREKSDHDDWSCWKDMAAVGLVSLWVCGNVAKVDFNDSGLSLVGRLRKHKAEGKGLTTFIAEPGGFS